MLREHETFVWGFPSDYACKACPDERWHDYQGALDHQAAAVVAAIPSLPVEALAELVGGEVERAVQGFPSSGMSEVPTMPLLTEPTHSRVVTPWRSVTSPEENR